MSTPRAILAMTDIPFRDRVRKTLTSLHWQVVEASGGAEALSMLERAESNAIVMDAWFPDLDVAEFLREVKSSFPHVDLVSTDGSVASDAKLRNSRRGELLYALRANQEWDGAAFKQPLRSQPAVPPVLVGKNHFAEREAPGGGAPVRHAQSGFSRLSTDGSDGLQQGAKNDISCRADHGSSTSRNAFPEFIGSHPCLDEVCRRIRLVAPRRTSVLIQGPSGTGKELVARAVHRMSLRSMKPFIAMNCAAIPDALLETEMFGHMKGAFTGAVQGRVGRIEAANGGTLFLDEVGEMPLPLQAKLLRFLESGEIQRVGDSETINVDVRIVAASNRHLGQRSFEGLFRQDLLYRLAIFLIDTPALSEHMEDLPELAERILKKLTTGDDQSKGIEPSALAKLQNHSWPGNVRELAHVLERAHILSEDRCSLQATDIEFAHFDTVRPA